MSSDDFPLQRRSVFAGSAAALASGTGLMNTVTADSPSKSTCEGIIDPMEFFTPASLLNANEEPLTAEELVAVWAEPTARNEVPTLNRRDSHEQEFQREPGVSYPEEARIPLETGSTETVVGEDTNGRGDLG